MNSDLFVHSSLDYIRQTTVVPLAASIVVQYDFNSLGQVFKVSRQVANLTYITAKGGFHDRSISSRRRGGACVRGTEHGAAVGGTAGGQGRTLIVFLADDEGYGELGCQGNKEIPTPQIDSIAKAGIRFTSGYVSGPYCSPTAPGLMTGRYQTRFGHEFNGGGGAGATASACR